MLHTTFGLVKTTYTLKPQPILRSSQIQPIAQQNMVDVFETIEPQHRNQWQPPDTTFQYHHKYKNSGQ